VSAALAHAGASEVLATDLAPNLPLLRSNLAAAAHALGVREPSAQALKWGDQPRLAVFVGERFDVVVGSEVVYARDSAADLLDTLDALTAPHGVVLLAHGRNRGEEAELLRLAREAGWAVREVRARQMHPDYAAPEVTVLELARTRRQAGRKRTAADRDTA